MRSSRKKMQDALPPHPPSHNRVNLKVVKYYEDKTELIVRNTACIYTNIMQERKGTTKCRL